MFDPNSITPPSDYVDYIANNSSRNEFKSAIFWARWGAAQAAEALKYQMPTDGIRDRPPTAEDANEGGYVQVLAEQSDLLRADGTRSVWWYLQDWELAAERGAVWLHTPDCVPNPKLALKREGVALLNRILPIVLDDEGSSISPEQVALLRRVAALISEETTSARNKTTQATPLTIGGRVVKPGDSLVLRNREAIVVHEISGGDDLWQVAYKDTFGERSIAVYADGKSLFEREHDIVAAVPNCAVSRLT